MDNGLRVQVITGITNEREWQMLKVITGDRDLDYSLKPIFLTSLQVRALSEILNKV